MTWRGFFYVLILGWGAALIGLIGCGEDESELCTRPNEGKFFYATDPPLINPDSTANMVRTFTDVVFDSLIDGRNFVGPTLTYRFLTPTRLDIVVDYNGHEIPIVKGETYTLFLERTQRRNPPSMALMISDGQGIRYLGVNDWRPGSWVFKGGYPDLNGDGVLGVVFTEAGCAPRVDDDCFRNITNYRLDFIVGTQSPLGLWNQEQGQVGSWIFYAHKAERVVARAECLDGLLEQNGISFSVERSGLR
jgi:hypothetical protein